MAWEGYNDALETDPKGVCAVLRVAGQIPATQGRLSMSPSLELELAHIVERESRWLPSIQNSIGATGLIQFMPQTARDLGTTTAELKKMSRVEQSAYVKAYFDKVLGKVGPAARPGDLYIATFYPAAYHTPDSHVIAEPGTIIWKQNPGLRCTPDGPITTGCVRAWGTPKTEPEIWPPPCGGGRDYNKGAATGPAGLVLLALALAYWLKHR